MARDSMYIGSTPCGEDCEQVGPNYRPAMARAECQAFIRQLRRAFGEEPEGARLYVKSNPHDFGTYLSVECQYDDSRPEAVEYAFKCEGYTVEHWDEMARVELENVARTMA